MAFFGFGAFSTPVGQLIERATDNAASAGNLPLHLQICDEINGTDNGPKDAVAAIRKRLTGSTKNFHIVNLTLTVLETCVKNCGLRFHTKIAQKDFLSAMMHVVNPRNNPPTIVKERILGLIQYWADAFKGKPQLVAVVELYEQLKAEGIEFPPVDLDAMAPVDTPERSVPAQQAGGQLQLSQPAVPAEHQQRQPLEGRRGRRGPIGPLQPAQVAKLLSELDTVRNNMDIMSEIMTENEPGKESEDDAKLLEELNHVLHQMQTRVADLIDRCSDEVILESTLVINDELNSLFVRYERYCRNREAATKPATQEPAADSQTQVVGGTATTSLMEPAPEASAISYPSLDPPPPPYEETPGVGQLIDLGSEIQAPPPQQGGTDIVSQLAELGITTGPAPTSQPRATDEFDIFAQSRTAYGTSQGGSTYDDNLIQQDASLTARVAGRTASPQGQPQASPYANLTEWLAQTDPSKQQPTVQESATSAEFDQFLEQRAAKGDSLPPARTRPQMQNAEEQSDELFAL